MKPTMAAKSMTLRLGQSVWSRDGKRVGRIERLVFAPESKALREFVLHQGRIWTHNWFVGCSYIDEVTPDGTVALRLSAAETDELPGFVPAHCLEILPASKGIATLPQLRHLRDSKPLDAVILDRHSRVEDREGYCLGELSGAVMTDGGTVSALEVTPGHGARFVLRIPVGWITSVRHDRIRLCRTRAAIQPLWGT